MSAVLEVITGRHATEPVKRVTQDLVKARADLRWRYDLSSSRRFPVQYYATALRGSGSNADEVLVIGIECFESDDRHLVVSATITGEDGIILAESPSTQIDMPSEADVEMKPLEVVGSTIAQIQTAFDSKVVWVDGQRKIIQDALARA